jgi:hypothetical protein
MASSLNLIHHQANKSNKLFDEHPKEKHSDEFYSACTILGIDPLSLVQKYCPILILRNMSDFWEEGISENVCRIRFDHYDKRRKLKLRQIQEFMSALKTNNKKAP